MNVTNRPRNHGRQGSTGGNSILEIDGVSFSADTFVVSQTFVFQIIFCGVSPALGIAAKRWSD